MKIKIDYNFITLNEYINIERSNKYAAANIKNTETNAAKMFCLGKKWWKYPCKITFVWHLKNKRKDLDNVAFAKKFILDGMIKAKTLKNDNLNNIIEFRDKVKFDKKEYVEVEINEV